MIVKINKEMPNDRFIKLAAKVLNEDGVIVYPTDTVYGLGCSIFSKKGIEEIERIKGREKKKPMSFICQSLSDASKYTRLTNFAYKIMKHALPGPYTFILEASKTVPKILQSKRKTVGIRIPDSTICMAILREFGSPIISTSANLSSQPELSDIYDIERAFNTQVKLYIDAGNLVSDPSTIVSLINDKIEVIREGKGKIDF
ncbi:L-threonylcarbamoyladenylate synthase [Thermodesulfobacteriota bacterium]